MNLHTFYQKDSQQDTHLTEGVKKYASHITSNPQEEEAQIDDFPPTPTNNKRRFYFTAGKLTTTFNTDFS